MREDAVLIDPTMAQIAEAVLGPVWHFNDDGKDALAALTLLIQTKTGLSGDPIEAAELAPLIQRASERDAEFNGEVRRLWGIAASNRDPAALNRYGRVNGHETKLPGL